MPTLEMSPSYHGGTEKQFYLITNVSATKASDSEIDLHAESWKLPYSIDDSELTFDGKPLNLLYEENRSLAEHHVNDATREHVSIFATFGDELEANCDQKSRGRSRKRTKQ